MQNKKIIAVFGATGAQGGSLARAILNDRESEFSVRAITRNVNSEKARFLADLGAEVVTADLDDPASVRAALQGAYGAFCVTFFWEHFSPEKEQAHAHTMAEAARTAGLHHVIWSSLEDTRKWVPLDDNRMPTLMGQYKVPHFDSKGEANRFFTDADLPVTILNTSFYWDNLIFFGLGPKKGEDGILTFALPMGDRKLPGIAAEDIGKCAYQIFRNGNDYIRKTVWIAGEHLSGQQMAETMGRAFGQEVRYQSIPFDLYRSFGFPGAEDMGNMFQFKHDFEADFCGARNIEATRKLNPELQDFNTWLEKHRELIPLQ
ncbi:MAG TPA: NmrA/HSCARG family protein [Bacteroidales bacterium]|nr:NmrA/HSCARG family protein [Bacteroidales bacterium]HSA42257.1 NmrA/HSCARG family protein [Bacteroidales bacterium]